MLPNFLVIGGNRCGTTWIAKNLRLHPEIYMPSKKELHFFDKDFGNGWDYYESYFPEEKCRSYKAIGEATPAYIYKPDIAQLIKSRMLDVKLIASLRNPIDRAYSQYWNLFATAPSEGHINKRLTFEEKLDFTPSLIEQGFYDAELRDYFEIFPKENILILIYEETVKNPVAEFKMIYEFLGVDANVVSPILDVRVNSAASKLGKSRALDLASKAFYRVIKIPALAKRIDDINARQLPEMNPKTRESLRQKYVSSISNLEQMLNKNLSFWV